MKMKHHAAVLTAINVRFRPVKFTQHDFWCHPSPRSRQSCTVVSIWSFFQLISFQFSGKAKIEDLPVTTYIASNISVFGCNQMPQCINRSDARIEEIEKTEKFWNTKKKFTVMHARNDTDTKSNLLGFQVTVYQLETMHMFQCSGNIIQR